MLSSGRRRFGTVCSYWTNSINNQQIVRNSTNGPQIVGIPSESLTDDKLRDVSIRGLEPRSKATLHLNTTNGLTLNFDSINVFESDVNGEVRLDAATPIQLQGIKRTYKKIIDPMGLFRTLAPREGFDHRMWSSDVTVPNRCTLSVYEGVFTTLQEVEKQNAVAKVEFIRTNFAKGVTRTEISHGRVRGTLFLPPKDETLNRKRPLIFTVHGGTKRGRVTEEVAALLASRGFPAMALGYWGVPGTPKKLYAQPADMSYFEEAINFATGLQETDDEKVAIWGISKGGEVTLGMCAFFPDKIAAAVIINSMFKPFGVPLVYKEVVIPPSPMIQYFEELGPLLISITGNDALQLSNLDEDSSIPFWNCKAPMMYIASGDDSCIDSLRHGRLIGEHLADHHGNEFKMLHYEDLGHLIDLPFCPVATSDSNPMLPTRQHHLYYGGGDHEMHSLGQEQAWAQTLQFFEKHL